MYEEMERAEQHLIPLVQDRLLKVCETEILIVHQQKINSGLVALLSSNRRDDLRRMRRLYRRMPSKLNPIRTIFKQHILKEGVELVREQHARIDAVSEASAKAKEEAANQPGASAGAQTKAGQAAYRSALGNKPDFIQCLLALHGVYTVNCFYGQHVFIKSIQDSFVGFVNKQVVETSTEELL